MKTLNVGGHIPHVYSLTPQVPYLPRANWRTLYKYQGGGHLIKIQQLSQLP